MGPLYREETNTPVVMSVLSGKGGVGRSMLAFNVSAYSAGAGMNVLTVDTDWYFGDQHILANASPVFTLADILKDFNLVYRAMYDLRQNWQLVASPSAADFTDEMDQARMLEFISELKTLYSHHDFIIIDTPSGSIELISAAAAIADINLIIINPEITSIADGYSLFKFLVSKDREAEAHLLVNRVDCKADADFIFQKFVTLAQKFLNRVPMNAGSIPDDRRVADAIARQKPVYGLYEEGETVESLDRLYKLLTGFRENRGKKSLAKREDRINLKKALADIKE